MPADSTLLSIVIPAFNEGQRIAASLDRLVEWLEAHGRAYEILVVDDGSSDDTAGIADSYRARGVRTLRLPSNQGKGAAVAQGVLECHGDRVLISDADFSTPISEIGKLEKRISESPVVIGSRAVRGARILRHQPLYREAMGKIFNKMLRLFGVWGLSDTQCGFKLLDGDVARSIFRRMISTGFAFDVELCWLATRAGIRVIEVGVEWDNSPDSRVQPLLDPPRMILEILRFRWHHRRAPRGTV